MPRWPTAGLLTRRAWTLFIPILAHVVREAMSSRFEGVNFEMKDLPYAIAPMVVTALGITRSEKSLGYAAQSISAQTLESLHRRDVRGDQVADGGGFTTVRDELGEPFVRDLHRAN